MSGTINPIGKKVGAPKGTGSKKTPSRMQHILKMTREGKTLDQISENVGVSRRTIANWRCEDWEFASSLKENRDLANGVIKVAVFQKAAGYSHPEEKVFCHEGQIIRAETTKHYPPDTEAAKFWLTNMDDWRIRKEDDVRIMAVKSETAAKLTKEEMIAETERLLAKIRDTDQKVIEADGSDSEE